MLSYKEADYLVAAINEWTALAFVHSYPCSLMAILRVLGYASSAGWIAHCLAGVILSQEAPGI